MCEVVRESDGVPVNVGLCETLREVALAVVVAVPLELSVAV